MSDYEGLIRVGVQGLGEIRQLNTALRTTGELVGNIENALINTGQIGESATRNVNRAAARRARARVELASAQRTVGNVEQRRNTRGQYLPGPGPAARRMARANLALSQREFRESGRWLREQERNRRLIWAVERRYIGVRNEANANIERYNQDLQSQNAQMQRTRAGIRVNSRGNFLTNLFQGRGRAYTAGGSGVYLTPELRRQARNVRAAWDIATANGQEDLPLMSALATEQSGLNRQQREENRSRRNRSSAFEAARRGRERIAALEAMPGSDPGRIRALRARTAGVIALSNRGDAEGARMRIEQMNAAIGRYTRELNEAAQELQQRQRAGARNMNVRMSWQNALSGLSDIGSTLQSAQAGRGLNVRASWQKALTDMSAIGADIQSAQKAKGSNVRASWQKALADMSAIGADIQKTSGERKQKAATGTAAQESKIARREDKLAALAQQGADVASLQIRLDKAKAQVGDASVKAQEKFKRSILALDTDIRRLSAGMKKAPETKKDLGFFRGDPRKAIGEGLIGGAFPLLFGQGLGASVGGGAGGFAGGMIGGSFGFGLSLIGTAVGAAVDATANNLGELAKALKSPNDTMQALEKSGFRVSDSLKLQVEQLQSVGRAYDAQTLVLQEVQRRLGPGSLTELNQLDAAQKRLQESWAAITSEIQVRLLPVLQGFVQFLGAAAGDISGFASQSRLQRLDPETFGRLKSQASAEVSGNSFGLAAGLAPGFRDRYNARLNELTKQELSKRFAGERAQVARTPQEVLADQSAAIQESRKIADQIQSAYREAFNLQRQAHDLQRDGAMLNKEIADYAYKKEGEILELRQQAAEKRIENNRGAAQNRIERGDLSARQAFAAATGFEQQLLSNVREVMRTRKEGEADIEQSRSRLELAMAKLSRDGEDYKRTNAREIEDIERRKLSYVRSVEDYRMRVSDYVRDRTREAADLWKQAMVLPDTEAGGGGGGAAMSGKGGYFARLAELESSGGKNWANPKSNARGFFQLIPKTENWLKSIGKSDLATRMLSRDFATASQAAKEFAILMRPAAKGLMEAGDVPGLDRLLNRIWTSLPGGAEAATGQRLARANALLAPQAMGGTVGLTGATGIGTAAHLDVRWADGRPISASEVDRFVRVGGEAPSSFGVTSGYGPRRAPVPGASTFHRGIDFDTPAGRPITLTGGARLVGSMTEAESGGGGVVGIIDTPMGRMKLLHLEKVLGGNMQASAAGQISSVRRPGFKPVPIGATPSAAPYNAANMAARLQLEGGAGEAQRIIKEGIQLKQKGIELGQIEQILQGSQLSGLQQQGDTLRRQIAARERILALSDDAASVADIEAEGQARIAQIEKDRARALAQVKKQYKNDPTSIKQVNTQADVAIRGAKAEEKQRRENLDLNNKLQNQERVRAEVLDLEQGLALEKAQAAALERGELEATNVELLKASRLYKLASEEQRAKLLGLTAETEQLRKQNEFRKRINDMQQDARFTGAGLRAGFIGTGAQAYEQGLKDFKGDTTKAGELAKQAMFIEDQKLAWDSLSKSITDVSNAISGGLTTGLVDIVGGAKKIQDVGRETLNSIAGTFAETAQQQLTTLLQRQLAGYLGGPEGPLVKMLGAGAQATGPQALAGASGAAATSLWGLNGAAAALGLTLQTVASQAAFSGALGGMGGSMPGFLSGFTGAPNLLSSIAPAFPFGGFLANGGNARAGNAYVVGENEPEFFFPGVSGRVVPQSDMEKAAALRAANNSGADVIDIRYTVTEQQGQRFVTEEQYRKGNAALLQRSQAATYAGMRNNNSIRDYVGI